MIFDYIALNKSNKKIEGEISAEDLVSARKRLHGMSLTVLAINERKGDEAKATPKKTKKDYASFEFKGVDKKGKEIVGTIDDKDALRAYIRLKKEFFFEVKYIFDLEANEIEKEKQKQNLASELQKKYELSGLAEEEEVDKKENNKLEELEKANIEKLNVLRNQIDVMLAQIKSVLSKVKDEPDKKEGLAQIKTLMGELERIKMSNNIKHIRSVAERILEIAESLFKNKEEYSVVIKQKKGLKSFDLDRLQQMQYKEAVEIKGISGALTKASSLFKKYFINLGPNLQKDQKTKLDKSLEKQMQISNNLLNEVDLIEKNTEDLKNSLKENLKAIFSFQLKPSVSRKTAFLNSKILLKVYLRKRKKENSEKEKGNFFASFLSRKKVDSAKKDYQKVFLEINNFIGWFLCFYLIYFYFGGLVLQKNLPFLQTFFYKTLSSDFLLILLFSFFIFHFLILLKVRLFRQSFFGTLFLFCIGVFSVLFYALNY